MEWNQKSQTGRGWGTSQPWYNLKNTLSNNQLVQEDIKKETVKSFEMNETEDTTYQNLWDIAKAAENLERNLCL